MDASVITGTAQGQSQQLEIRHSTLIHAEPERIFLALTTSEGLDAWFTQGASVNARPGGEIHFRWVDWGPEHISTEDGGPVLEATSPHRFVFQWHPDRPEYATTVEINIQTAIDGTIISLLEYGYADTLSAHKAMLNCAAGWGEALTLLKFYLEHGVHY
jgi:uncharacterized protein YndB with AHSA1/START domain